MRDLWVAVAGQLEIKICWFYSERGRRKQF